MYAVVCLAERPGLVCQLGLGMEVSRILRSPLQPLALTRHVQFFTHYLPCGWYLSVNYQHHQPEVAQGRLAGIDAWWINRSFQPYSLPCSSKSFLLPALCAFTAQNSAPKGKIPR